MEEQEQKQNTEIEHICKLATMPIQEFIRVIDDLDEADVIVWHDRVQINKKDKLSKLLDIDEFERLVLLLNKIQRQNNYSLYLHVEAIIQRALFDACNRARKRGQFYAVQERYGRDEQCREMTIYTIQS